MLRTILFFLFISNAATLKQEKSTLFPKSAIIALWHKVTGLWQNLCANPCTMHIITPFKHASNFLLSAYKSLNDVIIVMEPIGKSTNNRFSNGESIPYTSFIGYLFNKLRCIFNSSGKSLYILYQLLLATNMYPTFIVFNMIVCLCLIFSFNILILITLLAFNLSLLAIVGVICINKADTNTLQRRLLLGILLLINISCLIVLICFLFVQACNLLSYILKMEKSKGPDKGSSSGPSKFPGGGSGGSGGKRPDGGVDPGQSTAGDSKKRKRNNSPVAGPSNSSNRAPVDNWLPADGSTKKDFLLEYTSITNSLKRRVNFLEPKIEKWKKREEFGPRESSNVFTSLSALRDHLTQYDALLNRSQHQRTNKFATRAREIFDEVEILRNS